jgi:hypothetical protein
MVMPYIFFGLALILLIRWLVMGDARRRKQADGQSRAYISIPIPGFRRRPTMDFYYNWTGAIYFLLVLFGVFLIVVDG